jgi:hypothetical protein
MLYDLKDSACPHAGWRLSIGDQSLESCAINVILRCNTT